MQLYLLVMMQISSVLQMLAQKCFSNSTCSQIPIQRWSSLIWETFVNDVWRTRLKIMKFQLFNCYYFEIFKIGMIIFVPDSLPILLLNPSNFCYKIMVIFTLDKSITVCDETPIAFIWIMTWKALRFCKNNQIYRWEYFPLMFSITFNWVV